MYFSYKILLCLLEKNRSLQKSQVHRQCFQNIFIRYHNNFILTTFNKYTLINKFKLQKYFDFGSI